VRILIGIVIGVLCGAGLLYLRFLWLCWQEFTCKAKFKARNPGVDESLRTHPEYRKALKDRAAKFPACIVCGSTKKCQQHHKRSLWMFIGASPAEQLQHACDPDNLVTLCEDTAHGNHHLEFGHDGNFAQKCVPNVEEYIASRQIVVRSHPALKSLHPGPYWIVQDGRLVVTKQFTVSDDRGHSLTIPVGFLSDGFTGVYDPADETASIAHDYCYEGPRKWDDGDPITFSEANYLLRYLMRTSWSVMDRLLAWPYYIGVATFGYWFWVRQRHVDMIWWKRKLRRQQ